MRALLRHRRVLAIGACVFVAAAILFRVTRRAAGFWGIDDAGITYAAAFELADHGTVAAYVEGTPVESYSNPLVFFVVALLRWLGTFDPVATHLRIEMLLFAFMVTLLWDLLRRLTSDLTAVIGAGVFAMLELLTPATWLWYGSGLENLWVSTGLIALLWICARSARGVALSPAWGVIGFLVALTRPEAPVFVAGFYGALAAFARPPDRTFRQHLLRVAATAAVTGILFIGFLVWRRAAYGDWLPNTYYAKMGGDPPLLHNLSQSVIKEILPYARSGLVASSAIVLAVWPTHRRLGLTLLVLLVVSLALPITAGEDFFMGEHRFATPFLAVAHAAFAALCAVCVGAARSPRWRAWRIAAVAALASLPVLLLVARLERGPVYLDDVTIARVAELQGGERWEHQMRLGVPYAVAMIPDAGGSLLVGGMQIVDNAYLTDFDLAHMGRYWGSEAALLRQLNQYQHEERRPDLVDAAGGIGVFDRAYAGTRYLEGPGHLLARRDLVEVTDVSAGRPPLFDDGQVRIEVSDDTVASAGPGGLVRCELIVRWSSASVAGYTVRGRIDGGDRDEIQLQPYLPGTSGAERRALLLGAPPYAGKATVTIDVVRNARVISTGTALTVDVTLDDGAIARAADEITTDPSPQRAARRLAWLREQRIPRLGMHRFHATLRGLLRRDAEHSALAGRSVLDLRWTARLAAFEDLPDALRVAEGAVSRRMFERCPAGASGEALATRVACLGRVIDELRRLGYLDTLARAPTIAAELARADEALDGAPPAQRYQLLVGLTFAAPSAISLRRALIAQRRQLQTYPPLVLPQ